MNILGVPIGYLIFMTCWHICGFLIALSVFRK